MWFLIILIFISKISFEFISLVPYDFSYIIFQHGLHPYINIALNVFVGGILFLVRGAIYRPQYRSYHFFILLISLHLLLVTVLQILLSSTNDQLALSAFAACGLSIFTMLLFGYKIPTRLPVEKFVELVKRISVLLCWLSLGLLILSPRTSFMGGRFIGLFKHIPHMVSVATFCSVFSIFHIFYSKNTSRFRLFFNYASLLLGVSLLILTGTRSALASVFVVWTLCFLLFKTDNAAVKFLKTSLGLGVVLVAILFGPIISDYAIEVVTGERAVGYRAAQDGISSRWDEVIRGFDTLSEKPWLGHGLIYKFGEAKDGGVGSYNANKDPHNLLVSAGVIGGYIFMVIVGVAFVGLMILSLNKLRSNDPYIKILAIYMTSQIPILFIYHMHLSLGGIADRIYWIVIGYLALKPKNKSS